MPIRSVNLTDELDHFVSASISSGRYETVSEVVRAALSALERHEHDGKLATLASSTDQDKQKGPAEESNTSPANGRLELPPKSR